jgi:hypothetical protein
MPYYHLPGRREESAPVFDPADPLTIWQYFEEVDLLCLKHQVSDDAEKKQAATRYLGTEVALLWKYALSYSDLAHSYEDFKAEVIQMYPEVLPVHRYTLSGLWQLVSDRACTQICSVQELSAYHREFRLIT